MGNPYFHPIMSTASEGNLRILKAFAFASFFALFLVLIATYAFIKDPISVPGWKLFSNQFPTKSTFFYYTLAIMVLVFFLNAWFNRSIRRMPREKNKGLQFLSTTTITSAHAYHWLSIWNALVFMSVNLLLIGLILKTWEFNNPDLRFFSEGITGLMILAVLFFLFAFTYPLVRLLIPKMED